MRYLEFYSHSGYAHFQRQERSGGRLGVDALLTHQDAHTLRDPATGDIVIGLTLSGEAKANWCVNNTWRTIDARIPGAIGISPLEDDIEFDVQDRHSLLVLAINPRIVRDITALYIDDCVDMINLAHHHYYFDWQFEKLIKEIWSALGQGDNTRDLMVDGLTQALFARMLKILGAKQRKSDTATALLPIEHIEQYIRAEIAHGVAVEKLAALCGLPCSVFRHQFSRQTGCSPYQYVQQIRAQMAHSLLLENKQNLLDIAHHLGFSDQSHFARFCKQHLGALPSVIRTKIS